LLYRTLRTQENEEEEEMYTPMAPITAPTPSSNELSLSNENAATNHYSEILSQSWSGPYEVRKPPRPRVFQGAPTYHHCTSLKGQVPHYIETDPIYDEPVQASQNESSREQDEYIYASCEENLMTLKQPSQNGYQNQNFNKTRPKPTNVCIYYNTLKETTSKFSGSVEFDDVIYGKSSKK